MAAVAYEQRRKGTHAQGSPGALSAAEIDIIKRWIATGAKADGVDPAAPLLLIAERIEPAAPQKYPRPLPIQALAMCAAENPDNDTLLVGGYHELTEWSVKTGQLVRRHPEHAAAYNGAAFRGRWQDAGRRRR